MIDILHRVLQDIHKSVKVFITVHAVLNTDVCIRH